MPQDRRSLPRGLPGAIARIAERVSNRCEKRDLPFHEAAKGLFLADLHADTLLWGIEPLAPRSGGHVDGPRLAASGLGLQVFAAPTWTPLPFRKEDARIVVNARGFDQSHALFPTEMFTAGRPHGLKRRRALRIARRFHEMIEASEDRLAPFRAVPVLEPGDIDRLGLPAPGRREVGVMLALEGLHWVRAEAEREKVERAVTELHAAGYRMIAPTHRFSNGLGGSNEDSDGRVGLSRAGRRFVKTCLKMRIVLDLAHASPALIREACGIALSREDGARPVIVSHCGLRAVHPSSRNLSVGDVRAVAATGGMIGIGFWDEAMGWAPKAPFPEKMARIVESFRAALGILSAEEFAEEMEGRYGRYDPYEHLGFGSDFDGAVTTAFDVTGVSHVVAALAAAEDGAGAPLFPPEKLTLVAGGNARRVLKAAMS
ncbi:MAG: dipeptidase [Pikeienuella sp.]|uniref:dipeptidase n=1 Tax=Pikeienuella sp. TaxID=2831957 RepID=UPI00391C0BB8